MKRLMFQTARENSVDGNGEHFNKKLLCYNGNGVASQT